MRSFLSNISVRRIHFTLDENGKTSGDAYVELEDSADKAMVRLYDMRSLGDRYVRVLSGTRAKLTDALFPAGDGVWISRTHVNQLSMMLRASNRKIPERGFELVWSMLLFMPWNAASSAARDQMVGLARLALNQSNRALEAGHLSMEFVVGFRDSYLDVPTLTARQRAFVEEHVIGGESGRDSSPPADAQTAFRSLSMADTWTLPLVFDPWSDVVGQPAAGAPPVTPARDSSQRHATVGSPGSSSEGSSYYSCGSASTAPSSESPWDSDRAPASTATPSSPSETALLKSQLNAALDRCQYLESILRSTHKELVEARLRR